MPKVNDIDIVITGLCKVMVMKNVSHYHYHYLTQARDHNIYIINFWHLKLSILSVR